MTMQVSDANLAVIEEAIAQPDSALSAALTDLETYCRGRGTCLVIDHEAFGEALIADRHWTHDLKETVQIRDRAALVDLREGYGFKRLAILVEPSEDDGPLDAEGAALALAALSVTEELTRIATSWLAISGAPPHEALGYAGVA